MGSPMTDGCIRADRPTIKMASGIHEILLNSICRHAPEHYAVLAGYLSDPHRVTDCRPMPPMLSADGGMNNAPTHVQLNAPFIEYYLNMELLPQNKYFLGVIHTHPQLMTHLSGVPGGSSGDIPSIRVALKRAAEIGRPWRDFLAPIATVHPTTGIPTFTGWIIRLDQQVPIAADVIFEDACDLASDNRSANQLFPIHDWIRPYMEVSERVQGDTCSSVKHKRWMISTINKCMRADVAFKIDATRSRAGLTHVIRKKRRRNDIAEG
jgi:hypothetical protein